VELAEAVHDALALENEKTMVVVHLRACEENELQEIYWDLTNKNWDLMRISVICS